MEKELRTKRLEEISKGTPAGTGVKVIFDGETREYNTYKIPLEYLVYNRYNGRIGTLVKSYEKQVRPLNPEADQDAKIIEKFLWDSKVDRNEHTENDLAKNGQLKFGIVTKDGIIIDGNRRAMLLNQLYRNRDKWIKTYPQVADRCKYFNAVILPVEGLTKEVVKLETAYQMGEDKKLDYNPIEKYLKCAEMSVNFSIKEIADLMAEDESQIKKWISTFRLMEQYLKHFEYDGIYTRLEKTEDLFLNLCESLEKYNAKGNHDSTMVNWSYGPGDVTDLKTIGFDYIRARFEGKNFRYIIQRSKGDSVFCSSQKIWDDFKNAHFAKVSPISDSEKPVRKWLEENREAKDKAEVLKRRDEEWTVKVDSVFKENLGKAIDRLGTLKQQEFPEKTLENVLQKLTDLAAQENEHLNTPEAEALLKNISHVVYEMTKQIKENQKAKK